MSIQERASPDTPLRTAFEPRQVAFDKSAWQRQYTKQRLQDPEYREKNNKYQREYLKNKLATDPEYREKYNEYQRAYQKSKWATDPEYRARRKAIKQKYLSKLKGQAAAIPN